MKEVLLILYCVSLLICLIMFLSDLIEVRKPGLVEILLIIGIFILIFIPIVNTIFCFRIYKEYKEK